MTTPPMVSIVCTSYNHGDYLAEAIDSFLMQKTDFEFEILMYDDASTDHSPRVIKQYESNYPSLIKPIYQTENQYSKGVRVELFNHNRATGKYIAVCEGDDYWTDPYKLQKQVDYMEAHPMCSMTVHAADRVLSDKKKVLSTVRPEKKNAVFSVERVIEGGGDLIATNSMVYSKAKVETLAPFYLNAVVGDYPLIILAALHGTVDYLDDNMAAYRVGVKGSWTERELATSMKRINHYHDMERMFDEINEHTDFQYNNALEKAKRGYQFSLLLEQGEFKKAKRGEFRQIYLELGTKQRILLEMKRYFPNVTESIRKAKWKLIQ
ncbi:family 2 glycosyl transferase [Planococcus antarcticus DSM 14505]|uniref:Family 2 glycosyl transferase n=1 Tax=Planococcus antarcticus DSM 14505 TaxID=1185653 RepID=A0A1C7DFE8_9BACL|nr:glycosyltransferase [Planococcus antarcticus]ANU10174.1 glycosyl transferase family 2 [Planococcus antarcticus DSM 14505]EIM06123.1 family 2 glycosyl transferase [Planococcus antarcticus DSM 14505]